MDLSQLSNEDLMALKHNDLSKISDAGLMVLKGESSKKFVPTPENRGNVINTDVPTVVGERPNAINPQSVEKPSTLMDKVKAFYEVPTTVAAEAVRQPLAHAYGVARSIPEAISTGKTPAQLGPKYVEQALENMPQYRPTSPVTQNVLQTAGDIAEAAKLPPMPNAIGEIPSFAQAVRGAKPIVQEVVAPAAKNLANALREEGGMLKQAAMPTIEKAVEVSKPVVNKMAEALRREPSIIETAPSAKQLAEKSNELFNVSKELGVEINSKDFAKNMKEIGKSLEDIGYDPELHPDIATVLKRLTNPSVPKDFNKIKALRTMIGDLQSADTPLKRSIATQLKSEFDNYLSTIPESSVIAGSERGLDAWKEARDTYAKLRKSEVFDEMLEKAKLDKTKFTQSGEENSLAMQLRRLSENKKKMRLFTKAEQAEIKKAAMGGTTQNMLRFFGKFSPHGYLSGMGGVALVAAHPAVGIPLELAAIGSRMAATKIRKNDVNKLAALMRAGGKTKE